MKRVLVVVGECVLFILHSVAQPAHPAYTAHSARSAALGGCFLALVEDAWGNPALAVEDWSVGLGVESRFLAPGMATRHLALAMPLGHGFAASATYAYFGDRVYNEQGASLGFGLRLTRRWRLGVRMDYAYWGYDNPRYASTHRMGASVALSGKVGEGLTLGGMLGVVPADGHPLQAAVGMGWKPVGGFGLVADVVYGRNCWVGAGVEYEWQGWLVARVGYRWPTNLLCFGMGVRWRMMQVDLAATSHPLLGLSPQISLRVWL